MKYAAKPDADRVAQGLDIKRFKCGHLRGKTDCFHRAFCCDGPFRCAKVRAVEKEWLAPVTTEPNCDADLASRRCRIFVLQAPLPVLWIGACCVWFSVRWRCFRAGHCGGFCDGRGVADHSVCRCGDCRAGNCGVHDRCGAPGILSVWRSMATGFWSKSGSRVCRGSLSFIAAGRGW